MAKPHRSGPAVSMAVASDRYRYEELASLISGLVSNGTLAAGSRAPSLRDICKQRQVSMSTALRAYRLLEARRVLEARPQSGYYVAPSSGAGTPRQPSTLAGTTPVETTLVQMLEYAADGQFVSMSCIGPSMELLAKAGLDRCLVRATHLARGESNGYTQPKGDLRLRKAVARNALRWGQALSPEDILITCGCTEALTLALATVADAGDIIAVESPTYFGILQILEALRLEVLELPADPVGGISLTELEQALQTHRIKACLLCSSFNNPQGYTHSDEKKSAILRLLTHYGVPLVEDDISGDLHFGGERPKPFMALDPSRETIYCSSYSKTLAPGYRVGWMVPGRHMQEVLERKLALTLSGPSLPQAAMAEFLSSGAYEPHLRRLRRTLEQNARQLGDVVRATFPAGTRVTGARGGMAVWVQLPAPLHSRVLFKQAVKQRICFVPGEMFSAQGRYHDCLRLTWGAPWQSTVERAVQRLGELASQAP